MKHIISIHIIIILFSGICAYFVFYQPHTVKNTVITVNNKHFSKSAIEDSIKHKPFYQTTKEHINQIIDKELMVQEAIKEKINQDKNFQKTIKALYKNNLIQMLIKKKTDQFKKSPLSENIIKKYATLYDTKVSIKNNVTGQILSRKLFNELPEDIQYKLLLTDKRAVSLKTKDKNIIFSILTEKKTKPGKLDRKKLEQDIIGIRNKYMWNIWIDSIKKKAKIKINKNIYGAES